MSFDQLMIHHAAPTICGIKPSSLFSIKTTRFSQVQFEKWQSDFKDKGIFFERIKTSSECNTIFVFNYVWVEKILSNFLSSLYLSEKGYKMPGDVSYVVDQIKTRMLYNKNFPHEVGLLLGYPLEDVIEFEKKCGKACKYCGLWKTYGDIDNAKKCQCRYKSCSLMCEKWFDEGIDVFQIINKYKKEVA